MLRPISWQLMFCWVTFSVFHFFQQRHFKNLQGASAGFGAFLGLFVTASTIAWLWFVGWYWYHTIWYQALFASAISFLLSLGMTTAAPRTWEFGLSLSGFIVIPMALVGMFWTAFWR
jgi:hypothetical protein